MLDFVPLQGPGLLALVTIVISSHTGGSGSHPGDAGILGFTLRITVEAAIVLACAGSLFFTAIIQVTRMAMGVVLVFVVCVTDSVFGQWYSHGALLIRDHIFFHQ